MKKQSCLRSVLVIIEKIVVDFCTITGVSILVIYKKMSYEKNESNTNSLEINYIIKLSFEFIYENFFWLLLATLIITFIIDIYILPYYKIHKKDIPPSEAKPSKIKIITIGIIIFATLFVCINIYLLQDNSVYANDIKSNNDENTNYYIRKCDNFVDENAINLLTPEEVMISEYIIECYSSVVPIEEWDSLSDSQIKYIYNGILAYSGMYFPSKYYERFSWYEDQYSQEDFPWKILNSFQNENLNNLRDIRIQRGTLFLK